jgi:hypothetical protein
MKDRDLLINSVKISLKYLQFYFLKDLIALKKLNLKGPKS